MLCWQSWKLIEELTRLCLCLIDRKLEGDRFDYIFATTLFSRESLVMRLLNPDTFLFLKRIGKSCLKLLGVMVKSLKKHQWVMQTVEVKVWFDRSSTWWKSCRAFSNRRSGILRFTVFYRIIDTSDDSQPFCKWCSISIDSLRVSHVYVL